MDEALHEYEQALETEAFESTKQLLQEHIRRMNAIDRGWRIAAGHCAHGAPLLEMLDTWPCRVG